MKFFSRRKHGAPLPAKRSPGAPSERESLPVTALSEAERAELRERSIRRRVMVVAAGLLLAMVAASVRALILQTVHHEQLEYEARSNYVRTQPLDEWRGDVRDRNGSLLALTVHRWAVTVDPQHVKDPVRTARALAHLLGKTPGDLLDRLGAPKETREERDLAGSDNPATRAARRAVEPVVDVVAETFHVPRARFDRRLRLIGAFYQIEQLQFPGVHKIVGILADAADTAAAAINADADKLRFFSSRGRRFAYLARDVDDQVARSVVQARQQWAERCAKDRDDGLECHNPLRAVRIRNEPKRYYPKREVATQMVGLVGPDDDGISGIERALEGLLEGGAHQVTTVKDRRGRRMYLDGVPADAPLGAASVELAVDEKIQAFAESAIAEACMVSGARAGFAVVMRVKTGEVLAAANFPSYNPNSYTDWFRDRQPLLDERNAFGQAFSDLKWAAESPLNATAYPALHRDVVSQDKQALRHRYDAFVEYAHAYPDATRATAFLDVYEPGSISKVFTIAAALEEGVVDLSTVLDLENGELHLQDPDDTSIRDTSRHDKGDLAMVMKKSSNIGAAKCGFRLGAERLERYFRAFGFGAPTGSGFPGEAGGLLLPSSKWSIVHLANISFGQGFAATGVQLATALSALGNDGKLMRPIVVKRVLDGMGKEVARFEPEVVRHVVSPKTARTVLDLMRGVVEPDGTGHRAYIPEYPVAGKTGTGQKSHLRKRGYAEDMWVATFFGVAPADDPELAVVVLVDEPKGKRHGGGTFAAPAFKRIMRWTLRYLGIPSPYETGKRVAWVDPELLAKRRADQPDDADDAKLAAMAPPVDTGMEGEVPVPDFAGKTMDQVRRLAHEAGLSVVFDGSGVATSQSVEAHVRVPAWSSIRVIFAPRAPRTPGTIAGGRTAAQAGPVVSETPPAAGGAP